MNELAGDELRFCPFCNHTTEEVSCAEHRLPTVPLRSASPSAELPGGAVVGGHYRIDGTLASGGMGQVYRATDLDAGRPVALKTLLPAHVARPAAVRRFYREAELACRLRSPHVVRFFAFGVDEATCLPYIAMELLSGPTLRQVLDAEGALPPARARDILVQMARALCDAESRGVVHRDLQPENIFVCPAPAHRTRVKVADFGIATIAAGAGQMRPGLANLTDAGQALGTPRYMAPEQIRGDGVDHRSDLYALGCVMHEMLTGAPPFVDGAFVGHLFEPAPALPDPLPGGHALPPRWQRLHARLLAKDPGARPARARDVACALELSRESRSPGPRSGQALP